MGTQMPFIQEEGQILQIIRLKSNTYNVVTCRIFFDTHIQESATEGVCEMHIA
jgi:hypothetical protein